MLLKNTKGSRFYETRCMSPVQPVISARYFSQPTEARSSDTTSQKARFGPRHRKLLQAHLQSIIYLQTRRTSFRQALHEPCQPTHSAPAQQSAYRPFHSTETAVLSVHNDLVRAVDDCCVSQLDLLDLSAAFDTVDHQVLLCVLSDRFGIRGTALN